MMMEADLSSVQDLAPVNAFGSEFDVGIFCNVDWGLASKFESDGGKVFGGGSGDDASDASIPGVED